jgi:zinc and cadmium transporter
MSAFWAAFIATTIIDLIELGSIILIAKAFWNARTEIRLFSFASGVLLATVFLDLLPEAFKENPEPSSLFAAMLIAMIGLFFVERLLHREHSHDAQAHAGHQHPAASRYFIIFGDGLHSAIDGVAIAVGFIASPTLGVITTLAVLAHEVPHQVGDYSILRRRGLGRWRALIVNFTSAGAALLGVVLTFALGAIVTDNLGVLIGATSGMLLYIAAVNLLPEILHGHAKGRLLYATPFLAGLLLITLLTRLLPA